MAGKCLYSLISGIWGVVGFLVLAQFVFTTVEYHYETAGAPKHKIPILAYFKTLRPVQWRTFPGQRPGDTLCLFSLHLKSDATESESQVADLGRTLLCEVSEMQTSVMLCHINIILNVN